MKKVIIGVTLSAILLYFSLRNIDFSKFEGLTNDLNYSYFILAIFISFLTVLLHSIRWSIILSPVGIKKVEQKQLISIIFIGAMAIVLFPFRLGELVKPYLLNRQNKDISISYSLGTIVIERVLDVVGLYCIFLLIVCFATLPDWLVNVSFVILAILTFGICCLVVLYLKTDYAVRLIHLLIKRFPDTFKEKVEQIIRKFIEGFQILRDPKNLFYAIVLSIIFWFLSGLSVYCLFHFHNLSLPFLAALVVLVITMFSIGIPSAPGFLGNFQFACIVALGIYMVEKETALLFSISYYAIGIMIPIVVGMILLQFVDFSFKELFQVIKNLKSKEDV